jgi:hypothetical protein
MTVLVRQVPMRSPRDAAAAASRWFVRVLGCMFGAAVVAGFAVGPRVMHCRYGESKSDIASATVQKYVYEAYPEWRRDYPSTACPTFRALNEYMNNKDSIDPWGVPYQLLCDPAQRHIYVRSLGEDRTVGTADDLWSTNAH